MVGEQRDIKWDVIYCSEVQSIGEAFPAKPDKHILCYRGLVKDDEAEKFYENVETPLKKHKTQF